MMKRRVTGLLLPGMVASLTLQGLAAPLAPNDDASLLKKWALSHCLARAFDGKAKADARSSAAGYLEFGSSGAEAYESADALVTAFLARNYQSMNGGTLHTMECIDLYHSKELDDLARKAGN